SMVLTTDDISDPSEVNFDSDDSMREMRTKKKKAVKKEPVKRGAKEGKKDKATPPKRKRDSDVKNKSSSGGGGGGGGQTVDSDEDDEQRGLVQDYDEDNLLNIEVPPAPKHCMTETSERLLITDITVENFKSYYGVRKIGPFHQSFTAIIGPNGSGKSNVIDALLFVFGYKASKIRSKKVSVLIHSSAGKDDLPSCSVTISFQKIKDRPDGTYDVMPRSGFNVSRTAYRNNSSEYRMDGQKKSFKEVAVRLKEVGIDLIHNRFLILQGEVEQIAMMKPKSVNGTEDGMLEYLEDIIGSSRYKMPIEKIAAKLDKLQEERTTQIAKVNMAMREKEELDEPVQTTLAYLQLQNEEAALKCKRILRQKYCAEDQVAKKEPERTAAEEDLAKVAAELAEVKELLKTKREKGDGMTKELEGLQASIHKTNNELEVLVQKDKKRLNDLDRLKGDMKKLEKDLKKEQDKLDEVTNAPEEAKAKMERLTEDLDKYKEELVKAQETYDEQMPKYTNKTAPDRERKIKLEEEYADIAARLADAQAKCKVEEANLGNLVEDYEKKRAKVAEMEKTLAEIEEKVEKDNEARERIRPEITTKEDERRAMIEERKTIDERLDEIRRRMAELAPHLHNQQHQEAQQRRATSRITDAFENAVKNGQMNGYIGRLGDLGSIDKKYDRAISANYGGPLDMYLVENAKTTQEGIALLKKLGLRTNFLSLDRQQRYLPAIKKIEAEKDGGGVAPRLFNQIDCDDKYKPAFFFAVNSAYVADTMDAAAALYKQNQSRGVKENVVTLDGCMVTYKGTFIGGGKAAEGKMGTAKVVRRESDVKAEEAAAKKSEEANRENRALDDEMRELVRRKRDVQIAFERVEDRLKILKEQALKMDQVIKTAEERVRVMAEQRDARVKDMEASKVDEKELHEKRTEIDRLKKERDAAADESKAFKARIKKIDNEMAAVYDRIVKPHETAVTTTRDAIETAEKEVGKQQAVINGAGRNIGKQQQRVSDLEKDLQTKREKADELTKDEEVFVESRDAKREALVEFERRKGETEEQLKEIRGSTGELDTKEVNLTKETKERTEVLDKIKDKIDRLKLCVKDADDQMSKLSLNNITELLFDIPEDMRGARTARRFLLDGESDSDLDDYEEFMSNSPAKKKELKEKKKRRDQSPQNKKRKVNDSDDDSDEEERAVKKEEQASGRGLEEMMERAAIAAASTEDDEPMEEETAKQRAEDVKQAMTSQEKQKIRDEMLKSGQMPTWSRKHIMKLKDDEIKLDLDTIEKRLVSMKRELQAHVLEDFKKKVDKLRSESALMAIIKQKCFLHREKLDLFKKQRLGEFMTGFTKIASSLRELYQMITLGGDASLELKDIIDPFLEGVIFMVRPPKKSWKQIENLSGGEKTLSSLALVFALHTYRPTPLYVMDEIDAALDFRNVSIIGHYIKERTKNAQFIIISLRNNMFELADRLVGIFKTHDCTRNVVVDPKRVMEEAALLPASTAQDRVRALMAANRIQTNQ
ncbi:hypothetical protein PRIPAC_71102, partial [Pristionchus pacificus]